MINKGSIKEYALVISFLVIFDSAKKINRLSIEKRIKYYLFVLRKLIIKASKAMTMEAMERYNGKFDVPFLLLSSCAEPARGIPCASVSALATTFVTDPGLSEPAAP
jgi:hypothetical protein